MGLEFEICCRQCKVRRNLHKASPLFHAVANREEALDFASHLSDADKFPAMLLGSFLWEHYCHDCFLVTDNDGLDLDDYVMEDFWTPKETEANVIRAVLEYKRIIDGIKGRWFDVGEPDRLKIKWFDKYADMLTREWE